ncbi:MAG: hypothetical protein ACI4GV_03120, partial [Acutalibacteraceae bacterium]
KKSKFFSLALMREGIKQTMGVGITLLLVSMFVSGYLPFVSMFQGYGFHITVSFGNFLLPIFAMGYVLPMIFIFSLFGFMNKRNSSDFYHSVPLNKSCVYITYAATAMLWCTFITAVSTLFSYSMYYMNPKMTVSPLFIGNTIGITFVLMLLIAAIALVAKGFSGTAFSNISIMFLLMFVPRIFIVLLTSAVQFAAPIVQINSIPLAHIGCNIIFLPISMFRTNVDSWSVDSTTIWYSLILAAVYLVGGFFLHRARKSETAETGSSFKWVQHVVRSIIGIVPTFIIVYPLAARIEEISESAVITAVVVSVLAYFLYELATTRSAKKLLYAIPLYLIVVAFDFVFVLGSHAISNSVVSYVPDSSEVKSVSVGYGYRSYEDYNKPKETVPYSAYSLEKCEYENKEMIDILCSSLADDVNSIKAGTFNKDTKVSYNDIANNSIYHIRQYDVTFHCKNGNDVQRTVYLLNRAYYFTDTDGQASNRLEKLVKDSENYKNALTKLPDDNEIDTISLNSYFSDAVWGELPQNEIKELWKIYKEEYNALSNDDKVKLNIDSYSNYDVFCISIYGYVGTNSFYSRYHITAEQTPKTLQKLSDLYNKYKIGNSSQELEQVLSGIDTKKNFTVLMKNVVADGCDDLNINNDTYYSDEHGNNRISVTIPGKQYISKVYNGTLTEDDYAEFPHDFQVGNADFDNIKNAVKILTDAAQRKCNLADKRTFMVEIYTEYNSYEKKEDEEKFMYSEGETNQYIINLTAEQYKELYDTLKKADHTDRTAW